MTKPDKWDEIAKKLESEMGWDWEVDIKKLAALLRDAEKAGMERAERKSDVMQQLAYANGMKAGWNMAEAGENIAHSERVAALVEEAMKELSAIRAAKETTPEAKRLSDVLSAAYSWIDTWAYHVPNCKGGNECTCGRTAILFELAAAKEITE